MTVVMQTPDEAGGTDVEDVNRGRLRAAECKTAFEAEGAKVKRVGP